MPSDVSDEALEKLVEELLYGFRAGRLSHGELLAFAQRVRDLTAAEIEQLRTRVAGHEEELASQRRWTAQAQEAGAAQRVALTSLRQAAAAVVCEAERLESAGAKPFGARTLLTAALALRDELRALARVLGEER